ncbi:MAG: 4Fe-4S dicluster domain-containing protein [Methanomassiliicoccales archaeon]|nr:4Fe-4S dicluster domain-containing protein [Methanomassiliicoccales archaeon]
MALDLPSIIKNFDLRKCMQCGKCSASCPAGFESNLKTRMIIYMAKSGIDVLDLNELWSCTTCYTCQERCPKGVKVTDAIIFLRNLAARRGNFPRIHLTAIKAIYDTSNGFPLTPEISKIRSLLGLSKEPADVAHNEEALSKFRRLMESIDIINMIREAQK